MKRFLGMAAIFAAGFALPVAAQSCGGTYTVAPGDSLSVIADSLYKDAGKWTAIHQANIGEIGENPNAIGVGQRLSISCIDGLPVGLSAAAPAAVPAAPARVATAPTAAGLSRIKLITGDDFAPFTDRTLENGGLLAEVMDVAMQAAAPDNGYGVFWINDWSAHLDPMLTNDMADMTFPWARPNCEETPDLQRCVDYHYSQALFEYLILLFVDKTRPVVFAEDADIEGRTLCRPSGYTLHMLDQNGRNWLRDDKVTLKQPRTVAECFEMLVAGNVDAVVLNEFTGRTALKDLNLKDQVDVVQGRPVSVAGLHVIISKTNPDAQTLLATVNSGLDRIKASGQYQDIVNSHMTRIWAGF